MCTSFTITDLEDPNPRVATFTFYVQTWDEYYTQTLTLGIVSGPVEGILTLCIVYAITAYLGGGTFWQRSTLEAIGVQKHSAIPEIIYNLSWHEWWIFYGGIVLVYNTLSRYSDFFFTFNV